MVRPESVLSLWMVLHDKVHDGVTLLISTIIKLFSIHTGTCIVISERAVYMNSLLSSSR